MNADVTGLTIAIPTRDRPDDLDATLASVTSRLTDADGARIEVLVIDDGTLPEEAVQRWAEEIAAAGADFRYVKKDAYAAGLLRSRLIAVAQARHDVIVFFDDDVRLHPGYLRRARAHFTDPTVTAVGGVDDLLRRRPLLWRLYERVILFRSARPGDLSVTSFGGAMDSWGTLDGPIEGEFLLGCNMSFRRSALRDLHDIPEFSGSCPGEDLWLSHVAARHGRVLIDPAMRIDHLMSPASRSSREEYAYAQLRNHHELLRRFDARAHRYLALAWTGLGLLALNVTRDVTNGVVGRRRPDFGRSRGSLRGLAFLLRRMVAADGRTDPRTR